MDAKNIFLEKVIYIGENCSCKVVIKGLPNRTCAKEGVGVSVHFETTFLDSSQVSRSESRYRTHLPTLMKGMLYLCSALQTASVSGHIFSNSAASVLLRSGDLRLIGINYSGSL